MSWSVARIMCQKSISKKKIAELHNIVICAWTCLIDFDVVVVPVHSLYMFVVLPTLILKYVALNLKRSSDSRKASQISTGDNLINIKSPRLRLLASTLLWGGALWRKRIVLALYTGDNWRRLSHIYYLCWRRWYRGSDSLFPRGLVINKLICEARSGFWMATALKFSEIQHHYCTRVRHGTRVSVKISHF